VAADITLLTVVEAVNTTEAGETSADIKCAGPTLSLDSCLKHNESIVLL